MSLVRTVMSMTRSCSTLLWLMLCSIALGTMSGLAVMNTAAAGTRISLGSACR